MMNSIYIRKKNFIIYIHSDKVCICGVSRTWRKEGKSMLIAVCDDEPYFISKIKDYFNIFSSKYKTPCTVISFTNGQELINYFNENPSIDVFILDIIMNKPNGIELAEKIRKHDKKVKIIFLTSSLDFAPKGYEINASRYWLKPLPYEKFESTMLLIKDQLERETKAFLLEDISTYTEKIYFDNIVYIETLNRKICVHTKNSFYYTSRRLIDYEKILDNRFYRCHSAYIVNMSYVRKIDNYTIELETGDTIYVSKGRKKDFLKAFNLYYNSVL